MVYISKFNQYLKSKKCLINIISFVSVFLFVINFLPYQTLAISVASTKTSGILPISSPMITYVSRSVIVGEGYIIAGGTAPTNVKIIAQVQNNEKQIVDEQIVSVDESGNWNIVVNKILDAGDYQLLANSLDIDMSSSSSVASDIIKVRSRPTLVLGNLEISLTWFFVGLILLMTTAFIFGWSSYDNWLQQLDRKVIIAKRDVDNIFFNIDSDIDELLKNYTSENSKGCDYSKMKTILKNMKDNLKKSRHYIVDNIRELEK